MNTLQTTFNKHLKLLREHFNLNEEVSNEDLEAIRNSLKSNPYLAKRAESLTQDNLISGKNFVLYVNEDSLDYIKRKHSDESVPGSIINQSTNLRAVLEKVIDKNPSQGPNDGRVRWLGIDTGMQVGKMGVAVTSPEEVEKMEDYTMSFPDGKGGTKTEKVKVSYGERTPTSLISFIAQKLTNLSDGRTVISFITLFPGDTKIDNKEMPMERNDFAKQGFYFVIKPT